MKKNAENGMMGKKAVKAEYVRGNVLAAVVWVVVSIAVVGMLGGCGLFDEEVTTSIDKKRGDGAVKAILDDSLALVINGRMWEESSESCEHWDNCDYGFINQGLFIVNYRKKQPPYWGDTVNDSFSIPDGLAYDSTLLVYKGNGDFGFWKAGKLPDIRKKLKWSDECTGDKNIKAVRPWKKGKILLKKAASCPYAVLDTTTGEVKKFEFTGEYAWLDGCDDITYMDGDVMCLKRLGKPTGVISLFNEGRIIDSLEYDHFTGNVPIFYDGYVAAYIYKKDFVEGDLIAKVSKNGFEQEFPETWIKYNIFLDSAGNSISYSSEDLFVTK